MAGFSDKQLNDIYNKTRGYCRYCKKKISFSNYGAWGAHGCWEVDHSIPLSRDGTSHMNNLFPSCIDCNREKGDMTGAEFQRTFQ